MPWFAGVERNQIEWFPSLDNDKCVQCGLCMNCGKSVFAWGEDYKPHVVKPNDCVVGCTTCANLCPGKAIQFQNLTDLRATYKKYKIWTHVRKEMLNSGKITSKSADKEKVIDGVL